MNRSRGRRASLLRQELIVCMGSGGVGKTSVSAALALAAARAGRNCALITIDPAQRLRDALGIPNLTSRPHRVDVNARGTLDAMVLDTKSTFDQLIRRFAPSAQVAERILANPLYREMSRDLGGSTDYMAMEKLHELLDREEYDTVIVDTPPSAHARDLLDAPGRIADLVSSRAARVLKAPASILRGGRSGLAGATFKAILRALERVVGPTLLDNLADFAANFEPLLGGFDERAAAIRETLRASRTSFVLVVSPEADTLQSMAALDDELTADGFPIAGVIANRMQRVAAPDDLADLRCTAALRRKIATNYDQHAARAASETTRLHRAIAGGPALLAELPLLPQPVGSLRELEALADILSDELTGSCRSGRPAS